MSSSELPDARTSGLIAVLEATGLLAKLLPEMDKKGRRARVKQVTESGWVGDAVAEAISDLQAVIVSSTT